MYEKAISPTLIYTYYHLLQYLQSGRFPKSTTIEILNECVVFTCLLPQHRPEMGFRPNSSYGRINRRGGREEKEDRDTRRRRRFPI
jgi:hypothetical protein